MEACTFSVCEVVKAYLNAANVPQMIQLETLRAAEVKRKKKFLFLKSQSDEISIAGEGCLEMPEK